jgi:D-alanyl-D-alanine dipeptidase
MKSKKVKKIVGNMLLMTIALFSCRQAPDKVTEAISIDTPGTILDTPLAETIPTGDSLMESYHLVDIQTLDATINVRLRYATTDNFTGVILYDGITKAYLQEEVARKLVKAQGYLQTIDSGLYLLVYDAARPIETQRKMYNCVKESPKKNYVASPERTGLHNYGAAVDITIADKQGDPIDMGTDFDHFGIRASIAYEDSLLSKGIFTPQQVKNRRLLRKVMLQAGFHTVRGEWWHFSSCRLEEAKLRYELIHFTLRP